MFLSLLRRITFRITLAVMEKEPKPVRSIRVGGVWDAAKAIAEQNGDNFADDVVTPALERYVARNRKADR
ncbi:hypothetical protein QE430_002468 [Microbacterium testaceum]|uniref:hypothetical protein n=1 Tax=Microbacterium testaceum TaxID=2033 RepID=UPI002781AB48|nr:hypothetical protein [Microbacterium testaceum]MDQ1174161.1 hypothetical protein [Microbacterium testaceum]